MTMQAVGAYLRRLREQQGLTMAAVAAAAGVRSNYVWRIEAAQLTDPSFAHLAALVRVVGGSADDVAAILHDALPIADAVQRADQRLGGGGLAPAVPGGHLDDLGPLLRALRSTLQRTPTPEARQALLTALLQLCRAWALAGDAPADGPDHVPEAPTAPS